MKTTGIIVLILVIFAAAVLAEVWRELHCFKITRYRIRTSKIKGDAGKVRIAFLSDLHNHVYGKENEELLLAIREAKPDLSWQAAICWSGKPEETGHRQRI